MVAGASAEAIAASKTTATNPEVLHAAALVIMAARTNDRYPGVRGKEPNLGQGIIMTAKISNVMQYFIQLAPDAGTYVNEADYFMPAWQKAF